MYFVIGYLCMTKRYNKSHYLWLQQHLSKYVGGVVFYHVKYKQTVFKFVLHPGTSQKLIFVYSIGLKCKNASKCTFLVYPDREKVFEETLYIRYYHRAYQTPQNAWGEGATEKRAPTCMSTSLGHHPTYAPLWSVFVC